MTTYSMRIYEFMFTMKKNFMKQLYNQSIISLTIRGKQIKKLIKIITITQIILKYTAVLSASLRKYSLQRCRIPAIHGGVSSKS